MTLLCGHLLDHPVIALFVCHPIILFFIVLSLVLFVCKLIVLFFVVVSIGFSKYHVDMDVDVVDGLLLQLVQNSMIHTCNFGVGNVCLLRGAQNWHY